jgi:hypothetical protein
MKNIVFIFIITIFLHSCIGEWDRKLDEKNVDTEIFGKTSLFSTKNVRLKIKEYKEVISLTLDYKPARNMVFPVDSFYGDTLTESRFFLRLLCDGKPIKVDSRVAGYIGFDKTFPDSSEFIIPFKRQCIIPEYHDELEFPLTVFHGIKAGNHNFEGELFLTSFYGSHYDTLTKETIELEMPYEGIRGKIKFKIKVPEIYQTTLYGEGLDLRNDDKFSPVGMDFSLRLGYPDIYWEVFYPAYGEGDFSFPYWRSREATYSTSYSDFDTVYLFHLSPKDQFKIGVYDRDDLSSDDYLGDWFGSVKEIESDSIKTLRFDNLKWFKIRAKQSGCINKK